MYKVKVRLRLLVWQAQVFLISASWKSAPRPSIFFSSMRVQRMCVPLFILIEPCSVIFLTRRTHRPGFSFAYSCDQHGCDPYLIAALYDLIAHPEHLLPMREDEEADRVVAEEVRRRLPLTTCTRLSPSA
ncbi:hypothetical protein C8F04DRAFT_1138392 [Mycena alexandri]|uniref:Uncharacterized protein n=1 Tax=Mycena alexandri TaxID=1745969 RepID=A0AAD6S819_9AGAR|nr:hypothetical protein C8F04DRAFT_1138392 [Mycena alexandri]